MSDERNLIIGQRIKTLCAYKNISPEELANAIGKNRATVYRYTSGKIEFPRKVLSDIAKHLGVTVNYLTCEGKKPNADLFAELRKDEVGLVNLIIASHGMLNENEVDALKLVISTMVEKRTPLGEDDCTYKQIINQGPQKEKISSLDYKKNRKSNL